MQAMAKRAKEDRRRNRQVRLGPGDIRRLSCPHPFRVDPSRYPCQIRNVSSLCGDSPAWATRQADAGSSAELEVPVRTP